jgi:hypothetical protein
MDWYKHTYLNIYFSYTKWPGALSGPGSRMKKSGGIGSGKATLRLRSNTKGSATVEVVSMIMKHIWSSVGQRNPYLIREFNCDMLHYDHLLPSMK